MGVTGANTLQGDIKCPHCGHNCTGGIGFRAGVVNNINYSAGDQISWDGKNCWPEERPPGGNFKTIGYFECENLRCETWADCYPEVQEMVITIVDDIIVSAKPVRYKPDKIEFEVFSPDQEIE